jgi:serine/threonine-protein kinase
LELVEGSTLADRISEGPIRPDEAMGIALQIASALEAAHEKRIVHRDLKPANIKVRDDGTVKVLDFGISKPIDPKAISGGDPVATTPAVTETGVILGTAAYMSPEQARGRFVDERTDIWAFGCLLYEMLTGQPAFGGEDVMMTLARVLDRDTDLISMPGTISPAVRHTIKLCLEKDPRKRISDIRDVRLALEGRFFTPAATSVADSRRQLLPWALAFVLAIAVGAAGLLAFLVEPEPQPGTVVRSVIARGSGTVPGVDISTVRDITISPDGTRVVYGGGARRGPLLVQSLDRLESEPLAGTDGGSSPVFSPNGRQIAFFHQTEGALKRIAAIGGPVSVIATVDGVPMGLSWGPSDTIVFATDRSGGLMRVSPAGGEPERLTLVDSGQGEAEHRWPGALSNGRSVLFTVWRGTTDESTLAVVSFDTDEVTYLPLNGTHPIHAPTGHLLYASAGELRAVPFDPEQLALTANAAVSVVEPLRVHATGAAQFDVADSGTLIYVPQADADVASDEELVWVERSGREEPISLMPRQYGQLRISPDGDRIVTANPTTVRVSDRGLTRINGLPLPPAVTGGWWAAWHPDGRRVAFQSGLGGVVRLAPVDGGDGIETLLADVPGPVVAPASWAPDASSLVFVYGPGGDLRIGIVDMETRDWQPLIDRGRSVSNVTLSPGGDWLAYMEQEDDRREIYVERFPGLGDLQLVSGDAGGTHPVWARDESELYYLRPDGMMMAASIDRTAAGLEIGTPEPLFMTNSYNTGLGASRQWDVASDGRFLMGKPTSPQQDTNPNLVGNNDPNLGIVHVQNWLQELERLAPLP